jgi:hypothetical protein
VRVIDYEERSLGVGPVGTVVGPSSWLPESVEDLLFGVRHFGTAQLGDLRRTRRLVQLADEFCKRPQATLPSKCGSSANYQGLLGLLDSTQVTHAAVLAPHLQLTHDTITRRTDAVTLLVGDITELDYTSKASLKDQLGPIGNGGGFGFECFNLLAVDPQSRTVLGVANQILFRRRKRKMAKAKIAQLPAEKRQSGLWLRATRDQTATPPGVCVVRVFDREGDINEVLQAPGSYLIRSRTNRRIRQGFAADAPLGKLHTFLRTLPEQGRRTVVVEPSPGRAGRTAVCGVSYAPVQICWPQSDPKPPSRAWGVRVWELAPPAGEEALEWLLLTNVPVESVAAAQQRIDWYECRWLSEEYHKALKTGVRIEAVQLTERERLEPLIGLLSVVALNLLWLRDAARDPVSVDRPAEELVDPLLVVLAQASSTGVTVRGMRMTVGEFYHAVARLGGYLGNFNKRPPGWQTLWRGWSQLSGMAHGVRTFRNQRNL